MSGDEMRLVARIVNDDGERDGIVSFNTKLGGMEGRTSIKADEELVRE